MSLAAEEDEAGVENTESPKLCRNCNERPSGFGRGGRLCEECRDAGVGRKDPGAMPPADDPPAREKKKPSPRSKAGQLHGKLKEAHFGASLAFVGITNGSLLFNKQLVDILENRSDDWAGATVALAEQDARIALFLDKILRAGVLVTFVMQTAGSLVVLGTMSGRVRVPPAAVGFLAPELLPFMQQPEGGPVNGAQAA